MARAGVTFGAASRIIGSQRVRPTRLPNIMSTAAAIPVEVQDPVNARILAVSEDKVQGFQTDPLGEVSRQSRLTCGG